MFTILLQVSKLFTTSLFWNMCKTTTLTVRLFIIWSTLQFNLSVEQHFVNEKFNFRFILQKQNIFKVVKYSCINIKFFLSLFVVFGHVQLGIFFSCIFPPHPPFPGGNNQIQKKIWSCQERKKGDLKESILPSKLPSTTLGLKLSLVVGVSFPGK